jgi:uncharacterized protein YbjT (DUF2867 family)
MLDCHASHIRKNQNKEDNMITVMGATGHTGKKITEALLETGEQVRALGRSESRLAEFTSAGAEVLSGEATDAAFLAKAFRGADAVYTLLPTDRRAPDYRAEQDRQGEAIVKAIRESGVHYVAALSSLGADLSEGTGVIAGLHAQEERLKGLVGTNVLLLRPVSFFENFYDALGLIKHEGINADSVAPDLAIPMVATCDIANVAAKALKARDWKGVVVRELLGPCDLSYAEATRILGERIGKPDLNYVQFSYADEAKALVQAGLSESFAELYVAMTRAFNEAKIKAQQGRTPENTTPTRFEDFVPELVRAYHAA